MFKSKSFDSIFNNFSVNILKKNNSFSTFNILNQKGEQKPLSYGEYMAKNINKKTNKIKRQKVIHNFYKKLLSKL